MSGDATSLPEAVYVWWSDIDQEWRIRKWDMTPFIEGSKYVREGVAVSEKATTADAIPLADIIEQIDHVKQNGIDVAKFGGQNADEGRCRELCAMYLREWVLSEEMRRKLVALSTPSAREPTKVDDILIRLGELEAERKRLLSKLPGVTEGTV